MSKDVQISPDGKWWWDGTAWQPVETLTPSHLLKGLDKVLAAADAKELWAFIGQSMQMAGEVTGDKTLAPGAALAKIGFCLLGATHAHILMGRMQRFIGQEEADRQLAIVLKAERALR